MQINVLSSAFLFLLPINAHAAEGALTVDEIISMAKGGASEDAIMADLARTSSRFVMTDEVYKQMDKEGIPKGVTWFMAMAPDQRRIVSAYLSNKLKMQDIVDLTLKGIKGNDILLLVGRTQSRFQMSAEEAAWMASKGVDGWVIRMMQIQRATDEREPFLERGAIDRGGTPVRGGKYYEEAVAISPGSYRLNHQLRAGEYDYFKVRLKNGQKITCSVRTPEISHHGGIALHGPDRVKITEAVIYNGPSEARECSYELYDRPGGTELYIVIGCSFSTDEHVIYEIATEDHFDAGSASDAGNRFETALVVTPGRYANNWLVHDDVDMYAAHAEKGSRISARVVPAEQEIFRVSIINEDRETVASGGSKQRGSVARASDQNASSGGLVYLKVDHGGNTYKTSGKYALEITTE